MTEEEKDRIIGRVGLALAEDIPNIGRKEMDAFTALVEWRAQSRKSLWEKLWRMPDEITPGILT